MIVPRTTREEILAKLRAKVDTRHPIFIASAGSGLVAKLLEKAKGNRVGDPGFDRRHDVDADGRVTGHDLKFVEAWLGSAIAVP